MTMHPSGEVRVVQLEVGNYGNNCYVVTDPTTQESAIIDAPADGVRILEAVAGTKPAFVVITHQHSDHWGALSDVADATGATAVAHLADAEALPVRPERIVEGGDTLMVGALPLRVLHTPGHTAGSICIVVGNHLFTGDTLFPGGPGHSTSPDTLRQTIESITRQLYVLPPETIVYPGHGVGTTIGDSIEEYSVFTSRPHSADLQGDVLWSDS